MSLTDRFPALLRLNAPARRRVPFVQQLTAADCGAACLAMVLGYHGKEVRLDELRERLGIGRDGTTAGAILDVGEQLGLIGRGVSLELEALEYLEPGTILHWAFDHFVVFERLRGDGVDVVDPSFGPRHVRMEEFREAFTGVALLFEPREDFERTTSRARSLLGACATVLVESGLLWRILVTSLLVQVFGLALPILTGALVDRVIPRSDGHLLAVIAVGMVFLVVFHFLAILIRGHLLLYLRTQLDVRMTMGFLDHLVALPYPFFQRRSAGDLLNRLASNGTVRELLTSSTLSAALDGTLVCLYLAIIVAISPSIALLVAALGFLQVVTFLVTRRRQHDLMSETLEKEARARAYEVEVITGIETFKAMGLEQRAVRNWSDLFVDVQNVTLRRGRLDATVAALVAAFQLLAPLVILTAGGLAVIHAQMSLGTMLAVAALASGFLGPLSNLVTSALKLNQVGSYLERIQDVIETPREQADQDGLRPAAPLTGNIRLTDVSFRYTPGGPSVLSDVSVDVAAGSHVAIVGRSGAGKSTLAKLLLGLYLPSEGRVFYDGVDLTSLELRSVRQQMGIVTQEPTLLATTIRANIALADPERPMEAIVTAARLAQVHDEIMAMPMGYETRVMDRGASLSGGQRQRIALARALLLAPRVLLLDEATSALDAVTEAAVHRALAGLRCTRIVIAHRLSTIAQADVILVLDGGRVVEQGTHAELMSRRGVYHALVSAQIPAATPSVA